MKQATFYRHMISGDQVFAKKTLGYIDGGIGLVREARGWVGTHIPTGAKITPDSSTHSTARSALLEAEQLIASTTDILSVIKKVRNRPEYNPFLANRHEQLLLEGDGV